MDLMPDEQIAHKIIKNVKYKKEVIKFIELNGWKSDPYDFKHIIEHISFNKDGCYGIDISDSEIVLIDDTGDFMHIGLNCHSVYTLLGVLIYNRQLAMNFKI